MYELALTVQDSDTAIKIAKDEKVIIKLESEPGTGFEWIPMDKSVRDFTDIKVDYEPIKFTSPINAIELTVLSLEAKRLGQGEIVLFYLQPWNPESIKKTFRINYAITERA